MAGYAFTDICFVTSRISKLRGFYEAVCGAKAEGDDTHAELAIPGLAICFDDAANLRKMPAFRYAGEEGAKSAILGFDVEDVDEEYERLRSMGVETLNEPTTHSWGARSFQFKDPDGNILNFRSHPKQCGMAISAER